MNTLPNCNERINPKRLQKDFDKTLTNEIRNDRYNYTLKQRKIKSFLQNMQRRIPLLKENQHNLNSSYSIQFTNTTSSHDLLQIWNQIKSNDFICIEKGLDNFKNFLYANTCSNEDIIFIQIHLTEKLIELLMAKHFTFSNDQRQLFKCKILNILIDLSCDYDLIMKTLIGASYLVKIYQCFMTEILSENLNDNILLIQSYLLFFGNSLDDENNYIMIIKTVDLYSLIIKTIDVLGQKDNQRLLIYENQHILLNAILLTYNWMKYMNNEDELHKCDSIVIYMMELFQREIGKNEETFDSTLIQELIDLFLLISNRTVQSHLFFKTKVICTLSDIIFTSADKESEMTITSFKIISNILCVKCDDCHTFLQQGIINLIYQTIISINFDRPQENINEAFIQVTCKTISNILSSDESSIINFLVTPNIIQSFKFMLHSYPSIIQLEVLHIILNAILINNAKINSMIYQENIHLFLIFELKSNISRSKEYIIVTLTIIEQIITYGDTLNNRINYIQRECENNGFDSLLCNMQLHTDIDISNKAQELYTRFWVIEDDLADLMNGFLNKKKNG